MELFKPRYLKDGPGVPKNEPPKKPIAHFFELFTRKFTRLITLNLFYLLFWLPILAGYIAIFALSLPYWVEIPVVLLGLLLAGPATAGLVKVLLLFTEEKPVFMPSDFMDAFKENYWKAYLLSACDAVLFYLTSVAVSFYASQESFGFLAALPISAVLFAALVALFANFYAMPMIVKLKLGFFSILRNSLLLALAEIKNNFITLFWCAVIVVPCVLLFPYTLLAIIPLVPALVSFIACFNCWPIILRRCVLQGSDGETGPAEQIFEDTDGRNSDERQ